MFASRSLIVTIALCVGCNRGTSETAGPPTTIAAKQPAPLTIATFDEIQQAIAAHRGKIVVVDLWSTSCDPCLREFPNLVKLHREREAEGVACLSVSFDYEGGRQTPADVKPAVQSFLDAQHAMFENFLSSEDSDILSKKFGIPAIPIVLVYDRDGSKVATFGLDGEFTYADVNQKVDELLKR